MSLTSTARPNSDNPLALAAWSLVALGSAASTAFLTTPARGAVAGVVAALVGLAARAMTRASNAVDRILDEELDHR